MKKITTLLAALLICNGLMAGKVKTIIVADTRSNLRCGIQTNVAFTYTVLEVVAAQLEMVENFEPPILLDEFRCNKDELQRQLSGFSCTPEDVVLFFYFGHGARSTDDKSLFPQMQLKDEAGNFTSDTHVPLEDVKDILVKKGAKFVFVFGDCCNSEASWLRPKTSSLVAASDGNSEFTPDPRLQRMLRQLFIDNQGSIMTTGSQVGTPSYYIGPESEGGNCTSNHFGMYTNAFWSTLLINEDANLTWEKWLSTASQLTQKLAQERSKNTLKQKPIYQIDTKPAAPAPTPTPKPTTPPVTPKQEPVPPKQEERVKTKQEETAPTPQEKQEHKIDHSLQKLLVAIASDRNSYEYRERTAKSVLKEVFAPKARVEVIAQNGRTIVESETAADFLERISLAERLRNISIRQQEVDSNGRATYLLVHEVYEKKQ